MTCQLEAITDQECIEILEVFLHAVVEKEAGRGPLGLTEGRGGIVELVLLLGADLE